MGIHPPLKMMRLRTEGLASVLAATYGEKLRDGGTRDHHGWDLDAEKGTLCYAIADGTIEAVGTGNDYGNYVLLRFSRSTSGDMCALDTRFAFYAHLSETRVRRSQSVRAGDVIGLTGTSGLSAKGQAPHLHFEIRKSPTPFPKGGIKEREDPGSVLGYHYYSCR